MQTPSVDQMKIMNLLSAAVMSLEAWDTFQDKDSWPEIKALIFDLDSAMVAVGNDDTDKTSENIVHFMEIGKRFVEVVWEYNACDEPFRDEVQFLVYALADTERLDLSDFFSIDKEHIQNTLNEYRQNFWNTIVEQRTA